MNKKAKIIAAIKKTMAISSFFFKLFVFSSTMFSWFSASTQLLLNESFCSSKCCDSFWKLSFFRTFRKGFANFYRCLLSDRLKGSTLSWSKNSLSLSLSLILFLNYCINCQNKRPMIVLLSQTSPSFIADIASGKVSSTSSRNSSSSCGSSVETGFNPEAWYR